MSPASARKAPTPRSGLFLCPLPSAVSGAGPCRTGWTARGNRRLRGFGQIRGRLPPTGLPGGGDHEAHKGGHGGARSTTGRGNHNGHKEHKGGRGRSPRRTGWTAKGEPRMARIEADWGSATADRTARGGRPRSTQRGTRRGTKHDGEGRDNQNGHKGGRGRGPRRTGWTTRGRPRSARRGTRRRIAGGEGGRERSAGEARRATGGARKPPAPPCVFAVKSLQASKPPNFQASLSASKLLPLHLPKTSPSLVANRILT